ncbi:MAG TPA: alpha/beta hydrolase [Panacibacter sp.]|nr:alpha/beta hydrolase [Panacibacter sp.]HNP43316.1 alpha/beta hydrolase [Panacibacter sp.]
MVVYKQYNRQQLDNQYNNRLHVHDFADYLEAWDKRSETTRQNYSYISDLKYGDHDRERLDIFPSAKPNSKALIFIHGGYWQFFDKAKFHFVAETLHRNHITTALINYPLAPAAGMNEIVASCHKAIRWLKENLHAYNAEPRQLYIAGHSAGAHLAAMLLEKQCEYGISGACLISGLYNLQPIQLCSVNDVLKMDEALMRINSPVTFSPSTNCPIVVAVGAAETDEFKDQSRELYNNWKNKSASIDLLELPALNHFSIMDALADENVPLHKALLAVMKVEGFF